MKNLITCDITEKDGRGHREWLMSGITPDGVTDLKGNPTSGGLHIYGGVNACVRDSLTDAVLATGKSIDDVLQQLANRTGYVVTLEDECEGLYGYYNRTFTPNR
jgi:hypothetical protein